MDSYVTKQEEDYADQFYNLILSRVTIKTTTDLDFDYENEDEIDLNAFQFNDESDDSDENQTVIVNQVKQVSDQSYILRQVLSKKQGNLVTSTSLEKGKSNRMVKQN